MSKKVLLIEDEQNIIEAIGFMLGRDGWLVYSHSNGKTALDAIARRAPDVVVLDVMLPGRSGFDVLRDIRLNDAFGTLPVMMLTARGQDKDRSHALELGADRFMTKPFANSELRDAIRELSSKEGAQ